MFVLQPDHPITQGVYAFQLYHIDLEGTWLWSLVRAPMLLDLNSSVALPVHLRELFHSLLVCVGLWTGRHERHKDKIRYAPRNTQSNGRNWHNIQGDDNEWKIKREKVIDIERNSVTIFSNENKTAPSQPMLIYLIWDLRIASRGSVSIECLTLTKQFVILKSFQIDYRI